ncbi:YycH family regulatory protein [Terrilactibacillus tamarindi]|uniref:YycH family regulatory protein n=1 Tax=Terrilactibacillus tamarindi TaxID=2599694 RepID=UPI0012BBF0E7|nr:two-component system activity regulator YycH [Terrilactibacillus tamarindi]
MTKEAFKSIFLTVLVLLSITLTFSIWFYQTDYKSITPPKTTTVSIADSKNIHDVIKPYLAISYRGDRILGQDSEESVSKLYELFQKGQYTNVSTDVKKNLPSRGQNPSYEIVFPAPVTIDTLKRLFTFNDNFTVRNNLYVDRIEVFQSNGNQGKVTAVFRSQNDSAVFYASVNRMNTKQLSDAITSENLRKYLRQSLSREKHVYLPIDKTKVNSERVFYRTLDLKRYISVLYKDPDSVSNTKNTVYSDGSSQLEENPGNILHYIKFNPGINKNKDDQDSVIYRSYEFINGYKGWTNNFVYDEFEPSKTHSQDGKTGFRIQLGNYFIYNTDNLGRYLPVVKLNWESGQLTELYSTLIDMDPIYSKTTYELEGANEVIIELVSKHIQPSKLEDIKIGYNLSNLTDSDSDQIELTPGWFYKQNGRWHPVFTEEKNFIHRGEFE